MTMQTVMISEIAQLRNHIMAVKEMLVNSSGEIPERVYEYFTAIDKFFLRLYRPIDSQTYTDYPLEPEILEMKFPGIVRHIATVCIVDLIKRADAMANKESELEEPLKVMALIAKDLQHIGFELLHFVKSKERAF